MCSTLSSVEMSFGSFWKPSRGLTSTIVTSAMLNDALFLQVFNFFIRELQIVFVNFFVMLPEFRTDFTDVSRSLRQFRHDARNEQFFAVRKRHFLQHAAFFVM